MVYKYVIKKISIVRIFTDHSRSLNLVFGEIIRVWQTTNFFHRTLIYYIIYERFKIENSVLSEQCITPCFFHHSQKTTEVCLIRVFAPAILPSLSHFHLFGILQNSLYCKLLIYYEDIKQHQEEFFGFSSAQFDTDEFSRLSEIE